MSDDALSEGDLYDEDISVLEDTLLEEELENTSDITGEDLEAITPDTPVYRLRLLYSFETSLGAYPGDPLMPGDMVLVPTRYGRDLAQVICPFHRTGSSGGKIVRIERPALPEELKKAEGNRRMEEEAFTICRKKIEARKLEMKLVSVHYLLDEPKILFFFTAENRVDFRELVKDLVGVFKSRIELRQIGVRDEARVKGGLGVCGRCFCCHSVSDKLKPVAIRMAKDQNLSINSMKISGPCGRLLCCLSYEAAFYEEQRRLVPAEGCRIVYDGTLWRVKEANVIIGKIRLEAEDGREIQLPCSSFERVDGRWGVKS